MQNSNIEQVKYYLRRKDLYLFRYTQMYEEWGLVRDDDAVSWNTKDQLLCTMASYCEDAIKKILQAIRYLDGEPYEHMDEELDKIYSYLMKIESEYEYFHSSDEVDDVQLFCKGVWVFPRWTLRKYCEIEQRYYTVEADKRGKILQQLCKLLGRFEYDVTHAYDQCTFLSYHTQIAVKNHCTALDELKSLTQRVEQLAREALDQETLQWVSEMWEDIHTIHVWFEQESALIPKFEPNIHLLKQQMNHIEKFKWKLAPDEPSVSLRKRKEKIIRNAERFQDAIKTACKKSKKYHSEFVASMDDLYDRFQQLNQRIMELELDIYIGKYCENFWIFPEWYEIQFEKTYDKFLQSNFLRQKYLNSMRKQIKQLHASIMDSNNICTDTCYYSETQIKDSESALKVLKKNNQLLKKVADEKTLIWAYGLDDDIKQLSDCIQKRKNK